MVSGLGCPRVVTGAHQHGPAGAHALRVLVAPDSFGGSMTAFEAAEAIAVGWRQAATSDLVSVLPLADGGPGFVAALHAGLGGELVDVEVTDPVGRPTVAQLLVVSDERDSTAYVESADACGLHLLTTQERDPSRTTSAGLAPLLLAAAATGARRVVVGLGGSATNDGGAGLLEALGVRADALRAIELVAATDVDSPLLGPAGATAVFAAQKGATEQQLPWLEDRLARIAASTAPTYADRPGAGAAGGLGFALFTLGAARVSGADLVLAAVDLDGRVAASDLVITGEGSLDAQSLRGKLPLRVAASCRAAEVPCIALAGRVLITPSAAAAAGFASTHSVEQLAGSWQAALDAGPAGLTALAAQVATDFEFPISRPQIWDDECL